MSGSDWFLIGILSIAFVFHSYVILDNLNPDRIAFNEYTNNSVKGVAVHHPVMIIPMTSKNSDELNRIVSHEYLHMLIAENRIHFCGYQ